MKYLAASCLVCLVFGLQAFAQAKGQAGPGNPFDYDAKPPLDIQEKSVEKVEGAQVHDISYASPKGGRVPAYLVAPEGKGPFAGIIFLHWGQGDRTEFLSEALLHAQAGAVSLLVDAPHNRPDYPAFRYFADPEKERDMYIQLVVDLRRGVDLLLARPDVDPKRIGYVGHSLGATWGGALAGVEKRIRALVLMGGLPSLTDLPPGDKFANLLRRQFSEEQIRKYGEVISPINPDHFVGRAAPARLFFQFAKWDRFISERSAANYQKAASEPKEARWYRTSHEFNDLESLRDRAEWLRLQLGLGPVKAGAFSPQRR